MPTGSARVRSTAMVCGWVSWWTTKRFDCDFDCRLAIVIASAAAVASSSSDALVDVEAGQLGDQRLEVEQRLEATLADLGLVRRVRGVPGRVLEHVAGDHRGSDGAGVAHPDQAGDPFGCGPAMLPEPFQRFGFRYAARQGEGSFGADRLRHRLGEELLDGVGTDHLAAWRRDPRATARCGVG